MTGKAIRVGIIGAGPDRGWAARAHIPALRASPAFTLTAVGTTREESAQRAARQFGAAHAFTDSRQLAEHPEVDLVVVTVKVPAHLELVRTALEAGKHVYCEWPLATTTAEAELLLKAARAAGVRHAIGLQARYAPAVIQAAELLAAGTLGRVTSATVYSARSKGSTDAVPAWSEYTYDQTAGAGLLEVAGGHTLDLVEHLLGPFAEVSAGLSVRRAAHTVAETGRPVVVTSPDHLLLQGSLVTGAVVAAHVHDGKVAGGRTRLEISGTEGELALESTGPYSAAGVQISELVLLRIREPDGRWQRVPVPSGGDLVGTESAHVAGLYARLAEDIVSGGDSVPGFEEGVRLHRLLDTVRLAHATGSRQLVPAPEEH